MAVRHEGVYEFERRFPQGLLCKTTDIPEGCGAVYLITNLVNDKVYVGQTWRRVTIRWCQHKSDAAAGSLTHLHRAIRGYAPENFAIALLGFSATQEGLDNMERMWIAVLGSANRKIGYNLTFGGVSGRPTAETIQKMSEAKKKNWENPEYRDKMTDISTHLSGEPERREKMSGESKARWQNPDFREQMIFGIIATLATPEVKAKKSAAMAQVWENPAHRAVIQKGISNSQAKKSASMKKKWEDPAYREKRAETFSRPEVKQKQSEATKARMADPEVRKRLSEAVQAQHNDPVQKEKHRIATATALNKPGVKAKIKTATSTPEAREKLSQSARANWSDPSKKKSMVDKMLSTRRANKKRKEREKLKCQQIIL